MSHASPIGFRTYVANAGVKDDTDDFVCVTSAVPCTAYGLFTQSRFAGPCVRLSKDHLMTGSATALVAVSKNANVATGKTGERDAVDLSSAVAESLGIPVSEVLVAGTGVIGRRWPMDRLLAHARKVDQCQTADFEAAARGIMTTDTAPKVVRAQVGKASVTGIAKGVGMIEPNMATLLVFLFTDAHVEYGQLRQVFRGAVDRTFNCMSIDTDTSTSDTAIIMANGMAGHVDPAAFGAAVDGMCQELMMSILRDGEGATRSIEVTVRDARSYEQAKAVGKLIVNSPLVKTAVHGADPNWGRIAMAVGKAEAYGDIVPERTRISLMGAEVFPRTLTDEDIAALADDMTKRDHVTIGVALGTGDKWATVWGCDLSEEYVSLNADYTT